MPSYQATRKLPDESKLTFSTLEGSGLVRPSRVVLDSSLATSYGFSLRSPSAG